MPELTAEDFSRLTTLFVPETVHAVAFSPDGALLAVGAGDKVHVFRVPLSKTNANPQASQESERAPR